MPVQRIEGRSGMGSPQGLWGPEDAGLRPEDTELRPEGTGLRPEGTDCWTPGFAPRAQAARPWTNRGELAL